MTDTKPEVCGTCGSDDPKIRLGRLDPHLDGLCPDAFHAKPAEPPCLPSCPERRLPMSDAEKALREAHDMVEYELGRCEGSVAIDAAINLAVRAAWLEGHQCCDYSGSPDWLPKEES
jgi:hypothetical protein